MTELSFLLDLLLNHKLPKPTREAVTARIKHVEAGLTASPQGRVNAHLAAVAAVVPPHLVGQSPSTVAAMLRHESNGAAPPIAVAPIVDTPPAVAVTPAAAAALAERQNTIAAAISGKAEKGRTSPRKF
jgi:hypothetical protein